MTIFAVTVFYINKVKCNLEIFLYEKNKKLIIIIIIIIAVTVFVFIY